jgi:hypothetical protein
MGKQKHDIGWKKRQQAKQADERMLKGGVLTQRLIERGLAHRGMTDRRFTAAGQPSTKPKQTDR